MNNKEYYCIFVTRYHNVFDGAVYQMLTTTDIEIKNDGNNTWGEPIVCPLRLSKQGEATVVPDFENSALKFTDIHMAVNYVNKLIKKGILPKGKSIKINSVATKNDFDNNNKVVISILKNTFVENTPYDNLVEDNGLIDGTRQYMAYEKKIKSPQKICISAK